MHKKALVPFSRVVGGRRRKGECRVAEATGDPAKQKSRRNQPVAGGTNAKRMRIRAKNPACNDTQLSVLPLKAMSARLPIRLSRGPFLYPTW